MPVLPAAARPATRLMHRYLDRVLRRATEDPRATLAVGEVLHLLKPPAVLFHPRILLPALAGARGVALRRLGGSGRSQHRDTKKDREDTEGYD